MRWRGTWRARCGVRRCGRLSRQAHAGVADIYDREPTPLLAHSSAFPLHAITMNRQRHRVREAGGSDLQGKGLLHEHDDAGAIHPDGLHEAENPKSELAAAASLTIVNLHHSCVRLPGLDHPCPCPASPDPARARQVRARRIWLRAQRLDARAPFGDGPEATRAAVEHLGYVQIDTINVIERCHHHILYTRIPAYQRDASASGAERRQDGLRILDACAVLRADGGHALLSSAP